MIMVTTLFLWFAFGTVDFVPLKNSPTGELAARFDIVLGLTHPDHADQS
jgi:hypothetical protein